MSQVHSVTHVPVHSPLSEACLPRSRAARDDQGGRCGQERPAEEGRAGGSTIRSEGGDLLLNRESNLRWNLSILLFHMVVGYHGYRKRTVPSIQAVESPNSETRRSDVFRGRPTDCCSPRRGCFRRSIPSCSLSLASTA